MSPAFRSWDDYTYPGTSVLRNKLDLRDAARLREFEEDSAFLRMTQMLTQDPVEGEFDREHMKAIHRRIFGDVYVWAGQERVGPQHPQLMTKNGPSVDDIRAGRYDAPPSQAYSYFPAGEEMGRHFDRWVSKLRADGLDQMSPAEFARAIAEPWGEVNVAHLFREGNTRTQVAFFTYFARAHSHSLDYGRFSTDPAFRHKFNAGRFLIQFNDDASLFTEAIAELMDAPGDGARTRPPADQQPRTTRDDYEPNYAASADRASRCGAPTQAAGRCRRRGRCPFHR